MSRDMSHLSGFSMKILVRNLDRAVTEAEVLELFKAYGQVETCVVVKDEATGKSKGFGFVEMILFFTLLAIGFL